MTYLYLLAFIAGIAMALQAGFNAQLGDQLENAQLAAIIAFSTSLLFAVLVLILTNKAVPSAIVVKAVPVYLWFSGGLFSAFGISIVYFLIPKLGISSMMSYFLAGQLIMSVLAGHLGWFDMPIKPINLSKVIGVVGLVLGIILINRD